MHPCTGLARGLEATDLADVGLELGVDSLDMLLQALAV